MSLQVFSFPLPSPSLGPTSLLLDPLSTSLAVTLSDSSLLLFPTSPPPPLAVPTVVHSVSAASSSSSTFLLLNTNPKNPNSTLFLSASPSPSVVLRAWILLDGRFTPAPLSLNNRHPRSKTLALDLKHGFGVRVAGSVNYLAVYSAASGQIWVLGARMVGGDGERAVDLVKCAVIECVAPIYDLRVEKGVMVLGEVGGVRVFPLRPLVKGGEVGRRRSHRRDGASVDGGGDRARGKLRTLKLRQNSVSIRILSQKKLLVLDSGGGLYLLSLENSDMAGETTTVNSSVASSCAHVNRLDVTMKVQMSAVLPDSDEGKQVMWLSDGSHSVHVLLIDDMESHVGENDNDENKEKTLQISVIQAIFTSEKIQDIVPLSATAILLLGQSAGQSLLEYTSNWFLLTCPCLEVSTTELVSWSMVHHLSSYIAANRINIQSGS